ncbi:MAG: hypothetical protein IID37_08300 [Planctomycetes bacterium]|nr:hypothetical protein [Planctomycetota bacterium]
MSFLTLVLGALTLLFYATGVASAVLALRNLDRFAVKWTYLFGFMAFGVHVLWVLNTAVGVGGFPIHAKWQGLATAGLIVSAVTLPWGSASRWLALSLGTQATTAVLVALALIAHHQRPETAPRVFAFDVMLLANLAATSILLIASSYAAGYILLDAGLKRRATWGRLRQWPPLTVLSRRFTNLAMLGSVSLAVGLILGIVQRAQNHYPLVGDVHTWVVGLTLTLFLTVVASSKLRGLSLRTRAGITVCGGGLLFVGIAVGALNLYGSNS